MNSFRGSSKKTAKEWDELLNTFDIHGNHVSEDEYTHLRQEEYDHVQQMKSMMDKEGAIVGKENYELYKALVNKERGGKIQKFVRDKCLKPKERDRIVQQMPYKVSGSGSPSNDLRNESEGSSCDLRSAIDSLSYAS